MMRLLFTLALLALAPAAFSQTPQERYNLAIKHFQDGDFALALQEIDALVQSLPELKGDDWPDRGFQDANYAKAAILKADGQCAAALDLLGRTFLPAYQRETHYIQAQCQEALGDWLSASGTWKQLAFVLDLEGVPAKPGEKEVALLLGAYADARWASHDSRRDEVLSAADTAIATLNSQGQKTIAADRIRYKIDLLFGRTLRARHGLESLVPNADQATQVTLLADILRIDANLGNWTGVSALSAEAIALAEPGNVQLPELSAYQALAKGHLDLMPPDKIFAEISPALQAFLNAKPFHVTNTVRAFQLLHHLLPLLQTHADALEVAKSVEAIDRNMFATDTLGQRTLYQLTNQMALALLNTAGPAADAEVLSKVEALLDPGDGFRGYDAPAEMKLPEFWAHIKLQRQRGVPDNVTPAGEFYSVNDLLRIMGRIADEDIARTPTQLALAERSKRSGYREIYEQAIAASYDDLSVQIPWRETGYIYAPHNGKLKGGYGISELSRERLELAFRFSQSARLTEAGRAMLSTMARLAEGNDRLSQLLRRRDVLLEQRALVENATDPDARRARLDIDRQLDTLQAEMLAENPEFERLLQPRAMRISEVRDSLGPNEAVLKYVTTSDALLSFVVTRKGTGFVELPIGSGDLAKMVEKLRGGLDPSAPARAAEALNAPTGGTSGPAFDVDIAHDLYQHLVQPHLSYLIGATTLHVVADGPLLSIPFSMLVSEPVTTAPNSYSDYAEIHWAIREHAFSTLPILAALPLLKRESTPAAVPFVGVGDPVLSGSTDPVIFVRGAGETRIDPKELRQLAPLPETAGELRRLNTLVAGGKGKLLLGDAAREQRITDGALADTQVIAFATHGLLGGDLTGVNEPALVLTPPDVVTREDDGLLSSSEIAGLTLNADWVILSACNTAAGNTNGNAEGLSGLARAFLYAGSRGLLASHWPIQSDAAVALTTGMFESLEGGAATGAEALRASILKMMNAPEAANWQHPAAWAPFVVIGG